VIPPANESSPVPALNVNADEVVLTSGVVLAPALPTNTG
jgi:hypothetical protein